jgi:hypothetical protein
VVDYHPGTVVKLAASDLRELQSRYLGQHPIGVTDDRASDKIWVSRTASSPEDDWLEEEARVHRQPFAALPDLPMKVRP